MLGVFELASRFQPKRDFCRAIETLPHLPTPLELIAWRDEHSETCIESE
jgi:hypothetical protein